MYRYEKEGRSGRFHQGQPMQQGDVPPDTGSTAMTTKTGCDIDFSEHL